METTTWKNISNEFQDDLILGNGASKAVSEKTDKSFSYESLYEVASETKEFDENVEAVFENMDTSNFEQILEKLNSARKISQILDNDTEVIKETYENLRHALIKAVYSTHPKHGEIQDELKSMSEFLCNFSKVFSLNYDLLVYWAMVEENKEEKHRMKDCFINGVFKSNWEQFDEPYGSATGSTIVFYPHGNLVLATNEENNTRKISSGLSGPALLEKIVKKWENKDYTPLFVSEGDSEEKLDAIEKNSYLETIYEDPLRKIGPSLVIYGWSIGEQDRHILKTLPSESIERVAISSYENELDWKKSRRRNELCNQLSLAKDKVLFFESDSNGAWVY